MVTTPTWSGYRTRLTGLLGPQEEALADAIAASVYSHILHSLTLEACYPANMMADSFKAYHKELLEGDKDPKTKVTCVESSNRARCHPFTTVSPMRVVLNAQLTFSMCSIPFHSLSIIRPRNFTLRESRAPSPSVLSVLGCTS